MGNNELAHWGIKGMRWGIRRYQNKDGSLTPAGRKRYNEELEKAEAEQKILKRKERVNAKIKKLSALKESNEALKKKVQDEADELDPKKIKAKEKAERKAEKAEEAAKKAEQDGEENYKKAVENSKTKSYKDMTDEELILATNRLRLEKAYMESLPPEKVSEGKKMIMRVLENKLLPSAIDLGKDMVKDAVTNALKDKTGVDLDKIAESGSLDEVLKVKDKLNEKQLSTALKRQTTLNTLTKMQSGETKTETSSEPKTETKVTSASIDDYVSAMSSASVASVSRETTNTGLNFSKIFWDSTASQINRAKKWWKD